LVAFRRRGASGGEPLATFGPSAGQNADAAGRQHALAKTVAAFAHEAAWLIGTLHGRLRIVVVFGLERGRNFKGFSRDSQFHDHFGRTNDRRIMEI